MPTETFPSMTAVASAAARAAHPCVDSEPLIYHDTAAAPLLALLGATPLTFHRAAPREPVLMGARVAATTRARLTRDLWDGARMPQVVVLGAGLDTSAYVWPMDRTFTVYEVDLPGTIDWKRRAVVAAGLRTPATVRHVPVDLGREDLGPALASAGLDPGFPVLVSWLGGAMYLSVDAVRATLAQVSTLARSVTAVVEYILPASLRDEAGALYAAAVGGFAGEQGEPWLSTYAPDELGEMLISLDFAAVRHVAQRDCVPASVWDRSDGLRPSRLSLLALATAGADRPEPAAAPSSGP